MPRILHPIAATTALLTIIAFWLSTLLTETMGSREAVLWLKTHLPWALLLLIPALILTAATGTARAKARHTPHITAKRARMPWIAANGLMILVPSALVLTSRTGQGRLDSAFYAVQGIELVFGAVNIALLGLSFRDGLRLTGRLGRPQGGSAPRPAPRT